MKMFLMNLLCGKKINNNNDLYPDIDISPVKDDVVEYNTDDY